MTEGGFYQPPRPRRTSIAIVVMLHGAAITAVALSKTEVVKKMRERTEITWVKTPEPPPENRENVEQRVKPRTEVTYRKPIIELPVDTPIENPSETVDPPVFDDVVSGNGTESGSVVEPVPAPDPVRVDARLDRRSELQPPYPASEQRMGAEGVVSLRILIGPDGRVKAAEKVRATSEAFYQATLRHALRNWRFRPATLDGRPVESSKVMTVRFEIET